MAKRGRPRGGTPYRLEQRGRIWYAIYYDEKAKRTRRKSTGTERREEGERICAEWWAAKHHPSQSETDDVLIGELLAIYLDSIVGRPSAYQAAIAIEKYIAEPFSELLVSDLSPTLQKTFIDNMRARGLSEGYISRVLSVLRAALRHAWKYKLVQSVPFVFDVKRVRTRERWLSPDERSRLVDCCRDPLLKLFVQIGLTTGARPSAITELTWDRVDLNNRRLDFRVPGAVETNKRRVVSTIPKGLVDVISGIRGTAKSEFVFARGSTKIQSFKKQFIHARTLAGLDNDVTQYTMRHTFGAVQVQAGRTLLEVAKAMGHKDTRMVERHYGHLQADYQKQIAAVSAREFSSIFAPASQTDISKTLETLVGTVRIERTTPTMSTSKSAPNVIKLQDVRRHKKQEHDKN